MKKLICAFLAVLTLGSLCSVIASPVVAASNDRVIGQGITLRWTPVYTSDSKGWHEIGWVAPNTPIGIYNLASDWIKNDPNQWMPRSSIGVYGVDKIRQTHWASALVPSGPDTQIGEVVYANSRCKKMSGPGYGMDFGAFPEGTRLQVQNIQGGWLFVLANGNPKEPCWVPESQVHRSTNAVSYVDDFGEVTTLVAAPLINHLAGNGRAYAVTYAQVADAIKTGLRGEIGTWLTRDDGRFLLVIKKDGINFVGFLNKDGSLGSYFPVVERWQDTTQYAQKAANYINNVITKGGYRQIGANEIPQQVKDLWLLNPIQVLLTRALGLTQSTETMLMMFLVPEDWNKYLGPQEPTKL